MKARKNVSEANGSEENVVESNISDKPEEAIRKFLTFVRRKLLKSS